MYKQLIAKVGGAACISVALAPSALYALIAFTGMMMLFWAIEP